MSAVNGSPSLTLTMDPSCHPPHGFVLANGISHVPLATSVRLTLKSERPRMGANRNCPEIEFWNGPPEPTEEPVSRLRDHVNETCASSPRENLCRPETSRALYVELPFQTWPSIW